MSNTIKIDARFILDARETSGLAAAEGKDQYAALRAFLDCHGVPSSAYIIGVADCEQRTCLHFENGLWVIYFSERGARTNALFCASWGDAVKAFGYLLASVYADSDFPKIGQT